MSNERREYYLDNLRTIIILGLFLFHACEIYHLDEGFYIEAEKKMLPTLIYNFVSPWYMSVLFIIAGFTSMHSLKKRSIGGYCAERIYRILVPLLVGLLCWVPFESYWVLKNHSDFSGSMLDAWKYFFTHGNLFSYGYHGEFSTSHLWFLLSLFVVSFVCIPIIVIKKKYPQKVSFKFNTLSMVAIIIIIYIISYGTSDESTLKFIVFFALGVLLFDNKTFFGYLDKNMKTIVFISLVCDCMTSYFLIRMKHVETISLSYAMMRAVWAVSCTISVFAVIALGRKYLGFSNKKWQYLSNRSFAIYFIHMIPLIAIGYYVVTCLKIWYPIQILIIMTSTFLVTICIVEISVYIKPFRKLLKLRKIQFGTRPVLVINECNRSEE